jgi:thioredoxin reductase
MDTDWDCVVIGGGVAGLSAALVLGRARRRTLLLDTGGQSSRAAAHVGGLLAQEGTPPDELYARAHEQLARYDTVLIREDEAMDARAEGDGLVAVLASGDEVRTRAVVLATGMDYEVPGVPGFREHWGHAVFHCPFCHGWEVRDRRIAVYAEDAEKSVQLTALLRGWTDDVAVVDPGDVARLRAEDGTAQALVLHDGSEVACDGVLVHAPLRLRGHLHERLGLELTDNGLVAIDDLTHTSAPGVYAAGDIAVAPQQVAIALGSGHLAGVVVVRELLLGRPAQAHA